MTSPFPEENDPLQGHLDSLAIRIREIARDYQGDCHGLLRILRTIEASHQEIRVELFEPSLPDTRRDLYGLLRDIEESGGWPYIERMKLRSLLGKVRPETPEDNEEPFSADRFEK